jgi:hypothetical protein
MLKRGRARLLAGCLLSALALGRADAAHPCDPSLVRAADKSPHAYRLRGDRCEGLFVRPVALGSLLNIVSFTASFAEFDPSRAGELPIAWPIPGPGQIQIRAQSQEPELHYRMDTIRPPNTTLYSWPTDVLRQLGLQKKRIGVAAWTQISLSGRVEQVYVPLRIGESEARSERKYTLVLMPTQTLAEVTYSLVALSAEGKVVGLPVQPPTSLRLGSYPAERGFTITIAAPFRAGLYRIEIHPTTRAGSPSTTDLVFFNPELR